MVVEIFLQELLICFVCEFAASFDFESFHEVQEIAGRFQPLREQMNMIEHDAVCVNIK
jgi:hypothetical protein